MWQSTILARPPLSGELPEVHFEHPLASSSDWMWVRFEADDGAAWCGCFREGDIPDIRTAVSPDDEHFFLIAGSVVYCVSASRRELVATISTDRWITAIALLDRRSVALADSIDVTVVAVDGSSWQTCRIAWDGIRFTNVTHEKLYGVAETGHGPLGDRPFAIDLRTHEVTGGEVETFRSQARNGKPRARLF